MDASGEPRDRLVAQVNAWHDAAGRPSARSVALATGNSHTTVASTFSGRRVPQWARLERIVRYLGGDTGAAHALWMEHVRQESGAAVTRTAEEHREHVKAALGTAKSVLDEVIGLPVAGPEREAEGRSRLRAAALPVLLREFLGR